MMMSQAKSFCADERGNAFVEMALVMPVLATLLLGTVDISRAYSARVDLEQAAQRAIEKEQIVDYDHNTDPATIKAEAETAAGTGSTATVTDWLQCGTSTTKLDFTSSCADGVATARYLQVSIAKNFTPLFANSIFASRNTDGTVPLRAVAGVRVQ
jgi:Flp pilus assembly protein TadG